MSTLPELPSFDLSGKSALVTGGSRGIGLAAAAALSAFGARVTIVARNESDVEEAARQIGNDVQPVALDVTSLDELEAMIDHHGPFDVLVNNAGTNRPMPIWEVTQADYDAVMDLNLKSAFFVAQCVVKSLIKAEKPGSLIHMSSQMGQVGGPNRTLYCASKWGLEGMNKALALDLAPYGIRSNTIAPTFIETPMTKPFFEDEAFKESVLSKIKLGRLGQVNDLTGAIVFLASNASNMMTGSTLTVDGGWTAE